MVKRNKKIIIKNQDAIGKLNLLSPLYANADLEDLAVIAIDLLWKAKALEVQDFVSQLAPASTQTPGKN